MKYLLDTNVCIVYLNRPDSNVRKCLERVSPDEIAICSVVKAELFYGAMRTRTPQRTLASQRRFLDQFVSLPFDDQVADVYGRIRADLADLGTPIGPYDLQIAAIALAHHLTLITHNVREFSRVRNLQIEDWESE
ncbi:MAG: type II toxin-antitoxin system VapC family toxin [Cyanobacteria bacterium P01_A01_bin.114]